MRKLTVILLIGSACACIAADLSVDEVLQNYRGLGNRRITFVGLAEVEGDDFYIWDLSDKQHKGLKRTVSVWWNMRLPNYPPGSNIAHYTYLNLRRVRISGRIDTRFHGRWGDIPFGVILDTVEALPGDRERRFLKDVGVFHNSTSHTVDIRLDNRRGSVYCDIIGIPPSEYGETGSTSDYQEDHFISLELGGAPRDARNLWPEPQPRARAVSWCFSRWW